MWKKQHAALVMIAMLLCQVRLWKEQKFPSQVVLSWWTQPVDASGVWLETSQLSFWFRWNQQGSHANLCESDFQLLFLKLGRWKIIKNLSGIWGPPPLLPHLDVKITWKSIATTNPKRSNHFHSWSAPASNNARWSFCPEAPCTFVTPLHQKGGESTLENDGNILFWISFVYSGSVSLQGLNA